MKNTNSKSLTKILDIHFCESFGENKIKIVDILANEDFLAEEVDLENFVDLYSQLVKKKSIVENSYNNGLSGCLLRGKYGLGEVIVQIEFNSFQK